jgi:2-oxoisovalerate dehydrogenase E1 component
MVTELAYRSDTRPDFAPFDEALGSIRGFDFAGDAGSEIAAGRLTGAVALDLLDDMLAIRELEEMIVRLRSGGYDPLPSYDYRGPTHVSIGQRGPARGRPRHQLASRPRRRNRQGLRRRAVDVR